MTGDRKASVQKAVIPAAGVGTRLLPATKSQPKEMLPVGRKPVIQYVVEEIVTAGILDILIVTSQQKRAIEDHFDPDPHLEQRLAEKGDPHRSLDYLDDNCRMFYVRQSDPKGLADAIAKSEQFVGGDPFVVCLGDSIIQSNGGVDVLKRLMDVHERESAAATILFETVPMEEVVRYGIARPMQTLVGDIFAVSDLIEKPSVEQAPSNLAIAARYVFSPVVFDFIRKTEPGRGGEIQITDTMRLMLKAGLPVWGVSIGRGARRLDIGNYESYFKAFFELSIADAEFGQEFQRFVQDRLQK